MPVFPTCVCGQECPGPECPVCGSLQEPRKSQAATYEEISSAALGLGWQLGPAPAHFEAGHILRVYCQGTLLASFACLRAGGPTTALFSVAFAPPGRSPTC